MGIFEVQNYVLYAAILAGVFLLLTILVAIILKDKVLTATLLTFSVCFVIFAGVCKLLSPYRLTAYHTTDRWIVASISSMSNKPAIISDRSVIELNAPNQEPGLWRYLGHYYLIRGKTKQTADCRKIAPVVAYAPTDEVGLNAVLVRKVTKLGLARLRLVYTIDQAPTLKPGEKLYWQYHVTYQPHQPLQDLDRGKFVVQKG